MPKNMKKKKNTKNKTNPVKRAIVLISDDSQVYGIVEKPLGDRYFNVRCLDNKERRCRVRSKRMRIKPEDMVIISLRDFDDKNADIIHRYNHEEVLELQQKGILPKVECLGSLNPVEEIVAFNFEEI